MDHFIIFIEFVLLFFFLMCWFFGQQARGIEPGGSNLGIEPALPALKGEVLTTRDLQGRPISCSLKKKNCGEIYILIP